MFRWAVLLSALALTGACATKYQDMGFTGGVAAEQLTVNTWRILARGNGYTSSTQIQDFVLLKAAETTKSAGGTHFIAGYSQDMTRRVEFSTAPGAVTTFNGNMAFTTFTPGTTQTFIKPGQAVYIQVVSITPGTAVPAGAISADEIIAFIGPRLRS
jgi:hypothetical protein